MPALDTNALVRFIVRDDPDQLLAVTRLLKRCIEQGSALFIPVTVTLELEWVLRASFNFTKEQVIEVFANLLSASELTFESERAAEVALQLYREGPADFADCLHVALSSQAGQESFWTFDKQAARIHGAQAIGR
jgi:predicted nucleic-acid-binding protein